MRYHSRTSQKWVEFQTRDVAMEFRKQLAIQSNNENDPNTAADDRIPIGRGIASLDVITVSLPLIRWHLPTDADAQPGRLEETRSVIGQCQKQ